MSFSFLTREMGIDLGTANTLIFVKDKGIVVNEPSVIAVENHSGRIIATGTKAKAMFGKAPSSISVVKPLQDGVISDFDLTAEMLRRFIMRALGDKGKAALKVVVGVPSGVTEVEKRAVEEVVRQLGGKEVFIIDEPTAAAMGAGLNIDDAEGCMIADIGGGTSDIAILALGGIVTSTSIRYAGDKMNEAIIQYMRKKKGLMIGDKTAEQLKINVGSVLIETDEFGKEKVDVMQARGRDIISGLPKTMNVTSKDMETALRESMDIIIDGIKSTIEKAPPEIAADIAVNGMILSGGGGMIGNMDKLVSQRTGMKVTLAENPFEAVVMGAGSGLANVEKLKIYIKNNYKRR